MTRKASARLLVLGGLMLALGCRSTPTTPVITTPLLPDEVVPAPPIDPLLPPPSKRTARVEPKGPNKLPVLPPGAQLPKQDDFGPAAHPAPVLTSLPPSTGSTLPPIVPPKDITPIRTEPIPAAPVIKPLLVEAPRPPAGPDGFAPAPIIPPPPVVESFPPPKIVNKPPQPDLPLKAGERFGHAPDYKWIAGVLDRHTKGGYWTLRFADFGTDDPWGGKVRLLDDPRLNEFSNGDLLFVEGELLAPPSAATAEGMAYPPYRVTGIQPIK